MKRWRKTRGCSGKGMFYFWMGFLVPALVMLVGYMLIGIWPFGDGIVLIIDSLHQYLPFYTEFHEKLLHGESLFYSFSGGMGFDFWATYAYYMASPFNFLIALVPTANVADFMDWSILLRVALSGGIFSWYLHHRNRKAVFLPIVFGSMFALSNFLIGYYFNLMWLDSIAVLPLIMLGIERITEGKGGRLYGFALFYSLWCNYYIGFMLCIFSCLYLMTCFLARKGLTWKSFFLRCVRFGCFSLLAGGMASIILIPAFSALASSESMLENKFPTSIKFYTNFIDLMIAHFAQTAPLNISDSQVGLNAYCGTAVLALVILYLLDRRIDWREKLGKAALAGVLLLSFSMNILNYIWHGFHVQNGLPNRFAFLYIAVLLVMSFDTAVHLRETPVWKILVSFLIPLAFAVTVTIRGDVDVDTYGMWNWLTPALLVIHLMAALITVLRRMPQHVTAGVVGSLLLLEAAAHGIYGIECNGNVARKTYLEDQASFRELTARRGDDFFYRTEFDSQRMRNVVMFAGGYSVVMFNSTMLASVTDFCDQIGMEARTNKNGYIGLTKLMNDVLGIRYVLSDRGKGDTLYQLQKVEDDGNQTMYYNDHALSIGFMVNPQITDWDPSVGNPLEVQNSFIQLAAGMDGIFRFDRKIEAENGETYGIRIPENKQVYVYLPTRIASVVIDSPDYKRTYTTYTDHLYVINSLGDNHSANITTNLRNGQTKKDVLVYTCSDADYEAVYKVLAGNQMQDVKVSGTGLSGTIDTDRDGILLITVPYHKNWTVRADGETVQPLKIGGTLTGIALESGRHTITMSYTPGGFYAGAVLSVLCVLIYLVMAVFEKKSEKKKEGQTMELHFSKVAESFQAGIFAQLNESKERLQREGKTIYNLSVGTPDFYPDPQVVRAVSEAAADPKNYRYSLKDLPELTRSMQDFYSRRFGVTLEENEIMSIYGSQEGMAHIAWVLCDPGDLVLVPNPGYPIFKIGPLLCGAKVWEYPLTEDNGYLPKLDEIPQDVLRRAKFMVVNYPGNPLCKLATEDFYRELIAFAKENEIIIVHDNAYSDIIYGGKTGTSFLAFEGAKEVGVEFYSLSKSFDYTGARMSFVVGNAQIVDKFRSLRSQFDYGIFLPVQYGAVAALHVPDEFVKNQCREYEERMLTLCEGLRSIGWDVPDSDGTMFVWAPLPKGYHDCEEFVLELMEKTGVICVPGNSFGSLGEGYVRFALVLSPDELRRAVQAIADSGILKKRAQTGPGEGPGREDE